MQPAIAPQIPQRYTVIRELARGGMGRIWIGEDTLLSRRVAIKELLEPGTARALRFERELALTSRLEHPSIVSVHDGGTWRDGKPFYVMRLVTGESLERVINRTKEVGERIALLPHGIAVVDALAYAHAQGIVHRDLKPDNVLVGEFGETVVIDWGLAKDLRAATPELVEGPYRELANGATLGGEVLGTPAYMPPEQAMGDAVDERADVYALGAVLYHMLSGQRPHGGASVDEVLSNVISGPPAPLASIAPGVPPDLIAIVAKAMAREPAARYASARELATDLKRFQRGQLVAAHRYTAAQLARRWLRKHRTAVTVAALALFALAASAILSVTRIVREERAANDARALAEDRRSAAEGLVAFVLGDLHDKLEPVGKVSLLELSSRRALAYFDGRRELGPEERQSRAMAAKNLGDALRSRTDLAGAEAQYRAALLDRTLLVALGQDRKAWHHVDGVLHSCLADLFELRGDTARAIGEYRDAIAVLDDDAKARVQVLVKLAFALTGIHDLAGAERAYREALAIAEARVRAAPYDIEAKLDLVAPEQGLADLMIGRGDHAGALAAYRATLARIGTPQDFKLLRWVQLTQHRIGLALLAIGDTAGASEALRASVALSAKLVAHDPDDQGLQYERAITLGVLAQTQSSIEMYREAIGLLRAQTTAGAARDRMIMQLQLAGVLGDQKQWPQAELETREALATAEQRAQADPKNHQAKLDLAEAYGHRGEVLLELGRTRDAEVILTRALEHARTLDAADRNAQYNLHEALVELARARCALHEDGAPLLAEANALAARHLEDTPDDASWQSLDHDAHDACARRP